MPYNIVPDRVKSLEQVHTSIIPPPVLGWNTKDPLVNMDSKYAVDTLNYFSSGGSVELRKGYTVYARLIDGGTPQLSLFCLNLQNGTTKILCCSVTGRTYDITAGGVGGTDLSNGSTRNVYSGIGTYINYKNRIYIKDCNAVNNVWYWDGAAASLLPAAFVGPGGDDKLLVNPQTYKNRMYFCGTDLSCWFSDVDAVTGALHQYDFQSVFKLGGKLLFVGGTTRVGQINQQYFVAISSLGEILLYQGDSPLSATWSLIGTFNMPTPVGYRSFFYWGKDLVIITYQGLILLSDVLAGGDIVFLSDKINDQFVAAFAPIVPFSSDALLIMGIFAPLQNMIIITMGAIGETSTFVHFVMSTITRGWWKFSGIDGYHFANTPTATLCCGQFGSAYTCFNGYTDFLNNVSTIRKVLLRPAYNYMESPTAVKLLTEAQIFMYESNGLDITVDADVDYANKVAISQNIDTSKGNAYQFYNNRVGLTGIGYAASIRFDGTVTTKQRSIQAIKVFWKEGTERG